MQKSSKIIEVSSKSTKDLPQKAMHGNPSVQEILEKMKNTAPIYIYDQFRYYPAKSKDAWEKHFLSRLESMFNDQQWLFLCEIHCDIPYLLGCKISKWDEDHFGFKMAAISLFFYIDGKSEISIYEKMLEQCICILKQKGIKFVSARINGDLTSIIHLLESKGFRYHESNIWPIAFCDSIPANYSKKNVRLMNANDVDRVLYIAENYQYRGGHFYSDKRFDSDAVNSMFTKWVKTAWVSNNPIVVIEYDSEVAGCFVYKLDKELSNALGYEYARMSFLAVDSAFRGKGLGLDLFQGSMAIMKSMGAEYIDSGYSIKNHLSAKLHTKSQFYSIYQESTFHLWI